MINKKYIEKIACDFRLSNGISNTDAVDLPALLRKLNVLTIFKPLSDSFSGMALKHGKEKFMLINSNHRESRQNFTIAHELYHLFIQENFDIETSKNIGLFKYSKKDIEETKADYFSAFLLMPSDGIFKIIPAKEVMDNNISISTIIKAEQFFRVSRMALLMRLKSLNLIDSHKIDEYSLNVKGSISNRDVDVSLYEAKNKNHLIGDYMLLAQNLFEADKISRGDFASIMIDAGVDIYDNSNYLERVN